MIVDLAILPTFAKNEFRRISREVLQFLTSQHEIGDGRGLSSRVAGFDLVLGDVLLTHRLDLQGRLTVLLFHLKQKSLASRRFLENKPHSQKTS